MENFKWNSYENACWCFQIVLFRAFYFCSANFISFMNEILHSNEKNRTEREICMCAWNSLFSEVFKYFVRFTIWFVYREQLAFFSWKVSLFTFISSFSSFIWVKGLISKVVEYFFVGKFGPSKIVWDCVRLTDEFSQKISFFPFQTEKFIFQWII